MKRIALLLLICTLIVVPVLAAQPGLTVGIDQATREQWNSIISQFQEETGIKTLLHPYPANNLAQQVVLQGTIRSGKMNLVMVHKDWASSLLRYLVDLSRYEGHFLEGGISLAYMEGRPVGVWVPFAPDWFLAVLSWPDDAEMAVLFLDVVGGSKGTTSTTEPPKVSPEAVIASFGTTKIARSEHNPKLDGSLEVLLGAVQTTVGKTVGAMAADFMARLPAPAQAALGELANLYGVPFDTSTSTVTVVLEPQSGRTSSASVAALAALGVSRTAIEASTTLIKVSIPLSQLSTIASQLGGISFIRPPYTPHVLAITGEGIAAIGADAFHVAGITGSGVKVAIIDLGFAGLSQAQGRGDIPYSVQQHDLTGTGLTSGITHGTAIAEIVHEIAPGAQLYLIKIADEVDLDLAVTYCLNNGIDIINHSLGWYNTNFYDGIGTIAEIAKRSVAGGILWLNAAGNEAQSHWEGTFSDNNSDTWNDQSLTFSATSGSQVILYMTWDDWPQASNDYDLYLYDPSSNLVASSTKHQTGTEEPTESIMTTVSASGTYTVRVKGAGSKKIEIYNLYQYLAPAIAASSILAPGNVAEVVTVGAIDHAHYASGPLEPYSSQGPTNDGRTGIDLCAPDNVTTGTSPYTSFAGTSGATPHATGAAALLLAQDPSLSESALRARLLSQTVAMGSSYLYGHGRLVLSPPSAANQPPIAAFNANPSSTTVGSQVAFNGSASSDVDGTIVSYAWQYGDGITGFGVTVQHAYAAVGTYTVRLTVTDDDGATDMTTQQVVIASQPNQPPTAAFNANPSSTIVGSSVAFNGSASSDTDGWIVSYAWQYGDGATGFGVTTQHAYAAAGTYTVRLTVTDNDGATGTTTQQVVISTQPNQPPTAAFNASPSSTTIGSPVTFNGSASSDVDGAIVSYTWNFGDGMPGSGVTAQHAYAAVGTYTVSLTVTDNDGATGTTTQQVVISTQPNQPPTAAFNTNPSSTIVGSSVAFNGSASSDTDGWIVSYAWQYGDGATGFGVTTQHAYAAAGTYTVRLTVTDNDGATGTTTRQVVISAQPNQPPTAVFNSSPSSTTVGSAISFNGSASSDPDGWIVSYAWQYGDGATGSGTTVQHAYATAGTYTVRLTVTDNDGATGTTTRQVVISAQPNQPPTAAFNANPSATTVGSAISFNGSASSDPDGWIVSYAWQYGDGATGSGVSAQHAYAAVGTYTVRLTVTDNGGATGTTTRQVVIEAVTPPTGDGEWVSPSGYSDPDEFYSSEAKAFDDDTSTKARTVRGAPKFTWTTLIHFTLPAPRECSKVRFMVSDDYAAWAYGTIRVEIYRDGRWTTVYEDAVSEGSWKTVSFSAGMVSEMRIRARRNSVPRDIKFYIHEVDFYVLGGAPSPNQLPIAAFTANPSATTVGSPVSFNGSASSDPDGSIVSYAWQYGDGSTGSGVTTQHAYATAGTYTVRLTVTDNDGATDTTTRQITVGQATQPLTIQLSLPKTSYQVGEPIVINYSTNREAYVYICDADPSGKVTLLFPNYLEPNNRVPAGAHSFPSGGYTLRISAPTGSETLYAFAATSPISSFPTSFGSGFPILSYNPSSFLSSVRQTMQTQLPAGEGAEDILSFTVVSSAPQTGTLWVTSSPQGATVTIDGAPAGTTPIQVSVTAGTHTVVLALAGYQTVTQQATVFAGQTAYVQVPMTPQMQSQPPVAVINISSATPATGETIFFDGSGSTDPDGWIVSYLWDFGDGTGASGVQATHAYAASGTYLVHLMVSDNQGLAHTTSRTVAVSSSSAPPPPWGGGTGGEPPMGGTPGIFVWGTNTWHVTVNAGAHWTSAHSYRLEFRTDKSFSGVNQSSSGGVVPLGVIPTPTDGGKTLVFEGSLQNGSVDYTFTTPQSESIWMSLKLDIDGNGTLDESTSFVYLRTFMVHPPQVPFVVGLQKGDSGPLVPSINFRVGTALTYTASVRFLMWITDIATLEGP